MSQPPPRLAAVLLLLTLPAIGQDLRLLSEARVFAATYDRARGRLVGWGARGNTEEWDGSSWRMRSCQLLDVVSGGLDFETTSRSCLFVGWQRGAADLTTYRLHGSGWEVLPTPIAPSGRNTIASCYDTARGGLVLFGGWGSTPLADTWTFDGTTWTQRSTSSAPTARFGHVMAWDEARSRVVLFGGYDFVSGFADTWEWDGLAWQQASPGQSPPARHSASMAYDPRRSCMVLFGGVGGFSLVIGDLWEFDGSQWQAKSWAGTGPAPRLEPLAAFDPRLGECVFVGGGGATAELHDAWSWNGVRWSALPDGPTAPPRRSDGHVLSEPLGSGLLLFGGADMTGSRDDVWRWNGTVWTEYLGPRPSARFGAATCTGLTHAFLFGGISGYSSQMLLGDTWTWDGIRWSQVAVGTGPTARTGAAMAYDFLVDRVVLFGGLDNVVHDDTWIFDGLAWSQQQTAQSPAPRQGARMAYDLRRNRTVLFGGRPRFASQVPFTDTWEWDRSQWVQVATTTAPTMSPGLAMDFDVELQQIVLVGGHGTAAPSELWRFDGADWHPLPVPAEIRFWESVGAVGGPFSAGLQIVDRSSVFLLSTRAANTELYGTACGALVPEVAASQWPRVGSANFAIDVTGAAANGVVALLAADAPAAVPIAGCTLLVAPAQFGVVCVTNGMGFASQPLPLPSGPSWLGTSVYLQAAALRASAPGGFVLSRGLRVTIGN